MIKYYSILSLVLCLFSLAFSQENNAEIKNTLLEKRLETMIESSDELEIDPIQQLDQLEYYYDHPIILDKNCSDDLKELNLLTDLQIIDIMDHIEKYGEVLELEELQQIRTLDLNDINNIKPFITFSNQIKSLNELDNRIRQFMRYRMNRILQKSKAYSENDRVYRGDRNAINLRYQINLDRNIEAGINLEKDAGEEIIINSARVFDFQSFYIELKRWKNIPQIIIGDFSASFGQGLTFSSVGGIGKSSEVLLIQRTRQGFRAYKSINEFNYLRGAAAVIKINKLTLFPFISNKNLDANLAKTSAGEKITSLYTSGLHRSELEKNKIGQVKSTLVGLNINYNLKHLKLGFIAVQRKLSHNFAEKTTLYQRNAQRYNKTSNYGFNFSFSRLNYTLFGEISKSYTSGKSAIVGMVIMPDRAISVALSARKYDKDFLIISSGSFGDKSQNINENGIYSAIKFRLNKSMFWSVYMDIFNSTWLNYQVSSPSSGIDYLSEFNYEISKYSRFLFRIKWKEKMKDLNLVNQSLPSQIVETKKSLRIQFQTQASKEIRLRSRIEFSEYLFSQRSEQGILIFQELKYQKMQSRLSFLTRFTLFDTESYQSRIYTYEQDLTGSYSIPSFSGKGSKVILLIKYKLMRSIKLSIKVGHLVYDDRSSISSGNDEILGDSKTEIKWQIVWKL